ncbi:phage tail tube protein [uncultured Azohydromonas sp.]|jgi:hypothetical protein|uniref:phage tail tube protein n=1 Tax=uncultured Azohydromonas sp. TaxID=487342 RepID=UPI00260CC4B4|nr:phage tail tube protein [uncultured Azohydromonas sp.]
MGKKFRRALMLSKREQVYGQEHASGLSPANDAMLVRNLNFNPLNTEQVKRDHVRPHFGNAGQLVVWGNTTADFEIELAGRGAPGVPPRYNELLRMCSLSETITAGVSVVYAPISDVTESCTLHYLLDGLRHRTTGVRGNLELTWATGQLPSAKVSATGLYVDAEDYALAEAPNYTVWGQALPVNKANTVVTLFGKSIVIESVSVNMGNTVEYVNRPGQEYVDVTNQESKGTVVFEATSIAYKDWFDAIKRGLTGAFNLVHGGGQAGKTITFNAPAAYLSNPRYSESKGQLMMTVDMDLSAGLNGANDSFTLAYT